MIPRLRGTAAVAALVVLVGGCLNAPSALAAPNAAKGAALGGTVRTLVVDLNFLYHPSCRYSDAWQCPLAPAGNTITVPVHAGERY